MANVDAQTDAAMAESLVNKPVRGDRAGVIASGKVKDEKSPTLLDAATFVAEMTPIIGDVMAAKDVWDEIQREDTNWGYVGALGGAAIIGLIPGLGDAAAAAIKAGAKKGLGIAKRIEVDPNAMGSGLGNVRLKPEIDDVAEAAALLDSTEAISTWRKANKIPESKRQANTEAAKAAAEDLYQGNITSKEARRILKEELPVTSIYTAETMPSFPTVTQVAGSLGKKVQKTGVIGVKGFEIPAGTRVGSRLDIPAYNDYDTWVVSIHDGKNDVKGSVLGYGQAVRLKNIKFGSESEIALDIARGKARLKGSKAGTDVPEKSMPKATIARVYGDYVPEDPYALQEQARKLLSDPEWTQVGMNPYRQSNFYDKSTGMPVFEADEVIQIGPLVLARGVKKPTRAQLRELAVRTKDGKIRLFNKGGAVMNEQMDMAFAIGGLAEDVDPVSGNAVPVGSMPEEVRDDIPAQLSEGEYVVPADVVRFFGVKFFEDIRAEAKQGYAQMESDGRIGGEPVGGMEMGGDELPFDVSELEMVDDSEPEQPMMNKGGYISGYSDGGYNPYASSTGGFEIRTFLGPDGQKVFVQFMNGEPLTPVPAGFTPEGAAAEQVAEQVATSAATGTTSAAGVPDSYYAPGGDNDQNNFRDEMVVGESIDWTTAQPDKFLEVYGQMTGVGNKFAGAATVFGGLGLGIAMKGIMKLQANAMLSGVTAQIDALNESGEDATKLEEVRFIMQGKNADGSEKEDDDGRNFMENITSGDTYKGNSFTESIANMFTPGDGKQYINGILYDTKGETNKRIEPGIMNSTSNDTAAPVVETNSNGGGNNGDSNGNDTVPIVVPPKATKPAVVLPPASTYDKMVENKKAKAKLADITSGKNTTGKTGFAKGGLMKKK